MRSSSPARHSQSFHLFLLSQESHIHLVKLTRLLRLARLLQKMERYISLRHARPHDVDGNSRPSPTDVIYNNSSFSFLSHPHQIQSIYSDDSHTFNGKHKFWQNDKENNFVWNFQLESLIMNFWKETLPGLGEGESISKSW